MLDERTEQLIEEWFHEDPSKLRLKKVPEGLNINFIIQQIKGRKKAKEKFPSWVGAQKIVYPVYRSVEQSSSEIAAQWKAQFFTGGRVMDMTGGMGVDAWAIAPRVDQYVLYEMNPQLVEINRHNFKVLGVPKIECRQANSLEALKKSTEVWDYIYCDPARRQGSERVFLLPDCEPDVLSLQATFFQKSPTIILKLSPMLDISSVVTHLMNISRIEIVAIKNEVKEMLVFLQGRQLKNEIKEDPLLVATNLSAENQIFSAKFSDRNTSVATGELQSYIYEPNKALLKAELQDFHASQFQLKKLHPNTHLYTSASFQEGFQGRIFKLETNNIKLWKNKKLNVISRNHPLRAPQIESKYKLIPGDEHYAIAFKGIKKNHIIVGKRLK